jgi:seryl-tRNA synthetase
MLDLALIRAEPARVKAALARRGVPPAAVDAVVELDAQATDRLEVREALRLRRRRISEETAAARKSGEESADFEELGRAVGAELAAVEAEVADIETRRLRALYALPNLPATDTPEACTEVDNTRDPSTGSGQALTIAARITTVSPLHHADLIELLGLAIPADAAGPGRGFLIWRGAGARLVRALTAFMLDIHTREFGCEEIRAPAVTTRAALTNSAHLPLLEDKMYALSAKPPAPGARDLFLAPRAEPALANLYADKVLGAARLPIRLVSAGPAFRREASGGGAAARGLIRLHEFDTVELYTFARPDQDDEELSRAARAAETILARLDVPFRRRLRAAGDLSHAAARTIDFEVWSPGCDLWLPVAAISSFTDYQSRRTATRYAEPAGRPRLVHTIGGAAVALPHLVAAILENFQEPDGSVRLPPALAPLLGGWPKV